MKKVIIIVAVLLVFVLGGFGFFLLNNKKEDSKGLKINTFLEDNIQLNTTITKDNKLVLEVKNNGKKVNVLDIDVAIYEKEKLIKTKQAFIKEVDSKTQYIILPLPSKENGDSVSISKIDISATSTIYPDTTVTSVDKIEATHEKDKTNPNKINVTLKNTSNQVVSDVEVVGIFYKDDKIVGGVTSYVINLGKSKVISFTEPYTIKKDELEYISYDKMEVVINHAIKNK